MSRMLSSSLARDWMSSRSIGVMNVLFSSSKTLWTISSPWCSASLIRRHFIGTSRKSCNKSTRAIAPSSTVDASFSRRSKNWRTCVIIHAFNPMNSGRLHGLRVFHLLVRHRVHDDLETPEACLRVLHVGVLHLAPDAGDHRRQLAHGTHVREHLDLLVHLVERELPRHDLLR